MSCHFMSVHVKGEQRLTATAFLSERASQLENSVVVALAQNVKRRMIAEGASLESQLMEKRTSFFERAS